MAYFRLGKSINRSTQKKKKSIGRITTKNMDANVIMKLGIENQEELCNRVRDYWRRLEESDVCILFYFLIVYF